MDNTLYVGLSRQMTLRRELDVIANNVANIDTTGFKVESLTMQTDPQSLPAQDSGPRLVNFVMDTGIVRDFSPGSLKEVGGALNVAVDGQGFFVVQTAAGQRYTRDGRLSMDAQGRLVTAAGDPIQQDGGGDIVLDPTQGEPMIAPDGTVSQKGQAGQPDQVVGKIAVVDFASLSALSKEGSNLYRNVSNLQPQPSTTAKVRQGMLEASNVEPIGQITRLVELTRSYESVSKMVSDTGDLADRSIDRLGRLN